LRGDPIPYFGVQLAQRHVRAPGLPEAPHVAFAD
jgi:hypothetical protein